MANPPRPRGQVVRAQKVTPADKAAGLPTADELAAELCLYYPAYTFGQALKLSAKRTQLMLRVARRHEAMRYRNLVQIAAAPHTEKGVGVQHLLKHYSEIIHGR